MWHSYIKIDQAPGGEDAHLHRKGGGQLHMALSNGMESFYEKTECGRNENGY